MALGGALARAVLPTSWRDQIAYISGGSDHLADPRQQADRDVYHWLAGVVAALTLCGGVLYLAAALAKQARDDDDPAAVEDAEIDRRAIRGGVFAGCAVQAAVLALGGWAASLAVAAITTALALRAFAASLAARGLST